jgi:Kef-type K+ transport system membrane component KefB
MLFGIITGMWLLDMDFTRATLLASMYASHTLIAYPIVSKMGISKNRAVSITIAGTIITVTASLLILAVIVATTKGEMNSAYWIKFALSTLIFCIIVFWLLPKLSKYFLRRFNDSVAQYIFVMVIIFFASLLAQAAGLEGILGAFFAGLILNRLIPSVSPLMNRIEFVGNAIFIPFFLLSIGMQIDLRAFITSIESVKVAIVMTVVATATKWMAAKLSQITSKLSSVEGDLIFGLSNGQAAATLAAVMIGYNIGLLDENVLNGTIVMILVTCTISSIATERAARKIAIEETQQDEQRQKLGTERILIPISNPQTMPQLLDISNLIKQRNNKTLYALKINSDPDDTSGAKLLENAAKLASATDNKLVQIMKCDLNISNCIIDTVQSNKITDLIVGIHHKANIVDTFLGGTITSLINGTSNQNLIIYGPKKPINAVKRLIVAVPQMAELEVGFDLWFDRIKNIASQLSIPIIFYANKITTEALKKQCEIHSSLNVSFRELASWEDFLIISKDMKHSDTLIVITARKATVSYNNLFEKIPYYLNKYFTDNNFLLIYPQQTASDGTDNDRYNPLKIS